MRPIILIGYMASGKTTLGRALAHDLGLQFIDADTYLESRFHTTIAALFAERGEETFRRIERAMLHEIAEFEDVVIATGGGAPCFFDNMDYLNSRGTTVWLQASSEVICNRLTISHTQRPLVKGKSGEELRRFVDDALLAREPFYSRARFAFASNELEDRAQIATSVLRFKAEIPLVSED